MSTDERGRAEQDVGLGGGVAGDVEQRLEPRCQAVDSRQFSCHRQPRQHLHDQRRHDRGPP